MGAFVAFNLQEEGFKINLKQLACNIRYYLKYRS